MEDIEIPERVLIGALTRPSKRRKIRKYVNNWKAIHTQVVFLALEGKDHDDIMEITGFSRTAVDNILRTPEAKKIQDTVQAQVVRRGMVTTTEKLAAIQFKAIENIETFLNNPEHAASNPFAFYDRSVKAAEVATNLMKQQQVSPESPTSNVNNTQINNIVLTVEARQEIETGLNRAMEIAAAHKNVSVESVGHLASLKRDG